jgi:hypothetical protein
MAVPYPQQFSLQHVDYGFARTCERMLDNIESVRKSVNASRRPTTEIQQVIAQADEILAPGKATHRDRRPTLRDVKSSSPVARACISQPQIRGRWPHQSQAVGLTKWQRWRVSALVPGGVVATAC